MVKEALFIGGVIMVFLTYSVSGVILPSLTTKYVAKSMMVRRNLPRLLARIRKIYDLSYSIAYERFYCNIYFLVQLQLRYSLVRFLKPVTKK